MLWFSGLCQTGKKHNDDTLCHGSQDFATGKQHNDDTCYDSQDFDRQVNSTMMTRYAMVHVVTHYAMVLRTLPDR